MRWNKMLDDKSSVGISLGGNGGMNTEYDAAIWQNFAAPPGTPTNPTGEFTATAPTGVDLSQLFLGVTYARKLTGAQWLGITPFVAALGLEKHLSPTRSNGLSSMLKAIRGFATEALEAA